MRLLCVAALLCVGCQQAVEYPDVCADVACETAYAVVRIRQQIPPSPAPKPPAPIGDKCRACNGTGKMPTDGRIVIQCPECKGTGKATKAACPDGRCPTK